MHKQRECSLSRGLQKKKREKGREDLLFSWYLKSLAADIFGNFYIICTVGQIKTQAPGTNASHAALCIIRFLAYTSYVSRNKQENKWQKKKKSNIRKSVISFLFPGKFLWCPPRPSQPGKDDSFCKRPHANHDRWPFPMMHAHISHNRGSLRSYPSQKPVCIV